MLYVLQCIISSYISRTILGRCKLFCMCDLGVFVNNLIFNMYILTDVCVRKNYAVLNNSTFFDDTSTSYNRMFQRTFNQTSV